MTNFEPKKMGVSEELPPDNGMIDGTRDKFSTPVLVNPDIFLLEDLLSSRVMNISGFLFPTSFRTTNHCILIG